MAKIVAASLIRTRIDCANSTNINKLQRVQTSVARVVLPNLSKLPATVLFFELHWLPDNSSITVELACLTYKLLTTGHLLVSAHAATPLHPYTHSMVN